MGTITYAFKTDMLFSYKTGENPLCLHSGVNYYNLNKDKKGYNKSYTLFKVHTEITMFTMV